MHPYISEAMVWVEASGLRVDTLMDACDNIDTIPASAARLMDNLRRTPRRGSSVGSGASATTPMRSTIRAPPPPPLEFSAPCRAIMQKHGRSWDPEWLQSSASSCVNDGVCDIDCLQTTRVFLDEFTAEVRRRRLTSG